MTEVLFKPPHIPAEGVDEVYWEADKTNNSTPTVDSGGGKTFAEYTVEIDELAAIIEERTQRKLSPPQCRRAAFSVIGEPIPDSNMRNALRRTFAPDKQENLLRGIKRIRILDGGLRHER